MSIICPTVTAENAHVYREQIEKISSFANRLHVDLMDGIFTPNTSVSLDQVWWPEDKIIDVHLMHKAPLDAVEVLIKLRPSLVIIHKTNINEFLDIKSRLHQQGIKLGLALLAEDSVDSVADYVAQSDHVLIFSGNLGYQGGSKADLSLLAKVDAVKSINPDVEIGWDGGVNDNNVKQIMQAGIEVINVGGYIHFAKDSQQAYSLLTEKTSN